MHKLPIAPAALDAAQKLTADYHAQRVMSEAPAYPLFVDRLFKELHMVDVGSVRSLVNALVTSNGAELRTLLTKELDALDSPNATAMHAAIGCGGEGGEILDAAKKVFIYGKDWNAVDPKTGVSPLQLLVEELGDFRFYYQKFLNMLGLTDEDIQAANWAKLRVRYASGSYSDAEAQARADKTGMPSPGALPERRFMGGSGKTSMVPGAGRRASDADDSEGGAV